MNKEILKLKEVPLELLTGVIEPDTLKLAFSDQEDGSVDVRFNAGHRVGEFSAKVVCINDFIHAFLVKAW